MARTNSLTIPMTTSHSDVNVISEIDGNATLVVMTESVAPCTLNGLLVAPLVKEVPKSRAKKKRPNSPVTHYTSAGRKRRRKSVNQFSPNPNKEIITELTPKSESEATKVNFEKHETLSEKRITRSSKVEPVAQEEIHLTNVRKGKMILVKPLLDKEVEPVALTQEITSVKSTKLAKRKKILRKALLDEKIEPIALTQQEIHPIKSNNARKGKKILMKPLLDKEIEPVALTQQITPVNSTKITKRKKFLMKPLLDENIEPVTKSITPVNSAIVRKSEEILLQDSPPQIKRNKERQSTPNVTLEKVHFPSEDRVHNEGELGSSLPKLKKGTKRKAQSKLLVHHHEEIFTEKNIQNDLEGEKIGPTLKKKPPKILKRKQPSYRPFSDRSVLPSTSSTHLPEDQGLAETGVDHNNTAYMHVISANNFPRASLTEPVSVNDIPDLSKGCKTNLKKNVKQAKKKLTLVKQKWQKPHTPIKISLKLKDLAGWSTAVCENSAEQPNDQEVNHISQSSKCGKDKKLNTLNKTKKAQTKSKLLSKRPQLKTKKSTPEEHKLFNYPILNNAIPENKPGLVSQHRATEDSSDTSLVTVSTLAEMRPESTPHSWTNISTSNSSTSHLVPICGKIPTIRIIRLSSTNHRSLRKPPTLTDTTNSSSNRENLETCSKASRADTGQKRKDNNVDLSSSSDSNESDVVNNVAYVSELQKHCKFDESINCENLKLKHYYAKVGKERKIKENKVFINSNIPKPTLKEITFTLENKTIFRCFDSSKSKLPNSSSYAESHRTTSKDASNLLPTPSTLQTDRTANVPNRKDVENLIPPSKKTQAEPTTSKDAEHFLPPTSSPRAEATTKDNEGLLPSSSTPQIIPTTSGNAENIIPPSNTLTSGKARTFSEESNQLDDDTLSILISEDSIYFGSSAENSSGDYNYTRTKKKSNRQKFVCEKQNADSTSLAYAQPPSIDKTIDSELPSFFKPGVVVTQNNVLEERAPLSRSKLFHNICKANLDKVCPYTKINCYYYHIPNHKHNERVREILSTATLQEIINEYVTVREMMFGKKKFFVYANMFMACCVQRLHGPLIAEIMLDQYNNELKLYSIITTETKYLNSGLFGLNLCQMRKDCFTLFTRKVFNGRRFVYVLLEVIGSLPYDLTSICVELLQVVKDIGEQVPIETATRLVEKCCRESDNVELIEAIYRLVIKNTSNDILANVIQLKTFLGMLLKNSANNNDFQEYHKQLAASMTGYVSESFNRQSNQSTPENMCVPNVSITDAAENSDLAILVQRPPPIVQYNGNPPRMNLPRHTYRTSPDTTQYPDLMNNQLANSSRIPSLLRPIRSSPYQSQRPQGVRYPYQPRQSFRCRWIQPPRAQFHQRPRF